MRRHILCAIALVCMSTFAIGTHAATVMIDPATQESPPVGEALTVNVKVEGITGLFGYQVDLAFDNTALKFSDVDEGAFLKKDGTDTFAFIALNEQMVRFEDITPSMAADVNSASVLKMGNVRLGGEIGVNGTGILVTVTFEVLENKASTLELENVMMADFEAQVIPVDLKNGVVEEGGPTGIKGDVNGDGRVRSNDAILALRISSGLMIPTEYQEWAADVNEDGRVRSNDAILILRMAAGLIAPSIDAVASVGGQITITLAEAHGIAGESVTVPVKVDDAHGLAGGDISICYDQRVLRAVDVLSDSDALLESNLTEPGTVRIAFASADRLDSKTVAKVRFDILADDISLLTFRKAELYNPNALPLISRGIDRKFSSWAIPPKQSSLLQNFPNPLNPETWIPYQLKDAGEVTIRIYNTAGRLVRELDLGYKPAGLYISQDRAAHWDGKSKFGISVASGVYFYSIQAGQFAAVRKLIVLK